MKPVVFSLALLALAACKPDDGSVDMVVAQDDGQIKVTGELRSSNSYFFGPPAIPDTWNFTIAFMAPDGVAIPAGRPILRFDTEELMTKLRDKNNALNATKNTIRMVNSPRKGSEKVERARTNRPAGRRRRV